MLLTPIPTTFYNLKYLIHLGFSCGNIQSTASIMVGGPVLLVRYDAMVDVFCLDFVSCASSLASSLIRDGYICDNVLRNTYLIKIIRKIFLI